MYVSSPYWQKSKLTKSGRPQLLESDGDFQENDILIQNNVGLYQDNYKLVKYQQGKVYLTNRRLIFVDNHPGSSYNINLNLLDIDDISIYNGFLKSSPKVILKMRKKRRESHSHSTNCRQVSEVNWICPICSFSNSVKTDIQLNGDEDAPPCKSCGMKPPAFLIEGTIEASKTELTPANNVVSKDGFQCPTCTFINDVSLKNCEMCGTRLISSSIPPSLLQDDHKHKGLRLELENNGSSGSGSSSSGGSSNDVDVTSDGNLDMSVIKISFRKGGVKTFADKLVMAKEQAIWEHLKAKSKVNINAVQREQSPIPKPTEGGPRFGIQGLQSKREMQSFENSILLNNSLQDLENLMDKAKDLIKLSESYQRLLPKNHSNDNKISDTASILYNSKNSVSILNNIITKNEFLNPSAETSLLSSLKKKNKDSDLYIEELSRQIFEFLVDSDIITKNHGLITLFDLFIIYNRARGINLISPQELYKSVKMFETLKFKYILFEVPLISKNISDFIHKARNNDKTQTTATTTTSKDKFFIISNRDFTFNTIYMKILNYIDSKQRTQDIYYGVSILEIQRNPAIRLKVNYLILNQLLLECCLDGRFCVDQALQGSYFYKNEILAFDWDEYIKGNDRNIQQVPNSKAEFEITDWIIQNGVDDINYDYDEGTGTGTGTGTESGAEDQETKAEIEQSFNYRLGGKLMVSEPTTEPEEEEEEEGNRTPFTSMNNTLKDLQGLKF